MALRVLLTVLGLTFTAASRWSEAFRRQLSRDVVIEIRSDDGVAHQFVFRERRARSAPGRTEQADCAIRFATASQGFAALAAPDGPRRLVAGMLDGTVSIEGSAALALWFQGLAPAVIPGLPVVSLPATPPAPYLRPSSSAAVSHRITREPAEHELDPAWTDAAAARKKLLMMRVAAGEPVKPF